MLTAALMIVHKMQMQIESCSSGRRGPAPRALCWYPKRARQTMPDQSGTELDLSYACRHPCMAMSMHMPHGVPCARVLACSFRCRRPHYPNMRAARASGIAPSAFTHRISPLHQFIFPIYGAQRASSPRSTPTVLGNGPACANPTWAITCPSRRAAPRRAGTCAHGWRGVWFAVRPHVR